MSDQGRSIEAREFFLTDGESNDRDVFCGNLLIAKLLIERNVGVAIDCRNDCSLFSCRAEFLDRRDARLPVGVTERGVVDRDVCGRDAI